MTQLLQTWNQVTANQSRATGNKNVHVAAPLMFLLFASFSIEESSHSIVSRVALSYSGGRDRISSALPSQIKIGKHDATLTAN
jgi:hypothetical protein